MELAFGIAFLCITSILINAKTDEMPYYPLNTLNVSWFDLVDRNQKTDTVAFYNIFAGSNVFQNIVREQINVMKSSGLMDQLDAVYYATSGKYGLNFTIPEEKFKHLVHHGNTGGEGETLAILYEFCKANKDSKVLYFHDKGSFHENPQNNQFRAILDCFVLNPSCIDALDDHDVCGWRLSPIPFPHYSGNMWWANCQYISEKLIDPRSPIVNETFKDLTATLSNCIGSKGRYFHESWVTSPPRFKPADCMSAKLDSTYLYGYGHFPLTVYEERCPAQNTKIFGSKCTTASTIVSTSEFLPAINSMMDFCAKVFPECPRFAYIEIVKRTQMWYGDNPHSLREWMNPILLSKELLVEKTLVRPLHSKQVYIYLGNEFHAIPNLNTFVAMGLDFDDVKVITDMQASMMIIGNDVPYL